MLISGRLLRRDTHFLTLTEETKIVRKIDLEDKFGRDVSNIKSGQRDELENSQIMILI